MTLAPYDFCGVVTIVVLEKLAFRLEYCVPSIFLGMVGAS